MSDVHERREHTPFVDAVQHVQLMLHRICETCSRQIACVIAHMQMDLREVTITSAAILLQTA